MDDLFLIYCYSYLKGVTIYVLYLDQNTRRLEIGEKLIPPQKNEKALAPLYLTYCKGRYEIMKTFCIGNYPFGMRPEGCNPHTHSGGGTIVDSQFPTVEQRKGRKRRVGRNALRDEDSKSMVLSVDSLDPSSQKGMELTGELIKYLRIMSRKTFVNVELKKTFDGFLASPKQSAVKQQQRCANIRTSSSSSSTFVDTVKPHGTNFKLFYKNEDEEEEEEEEEEELTIDEDEGEKDASSERYTFANLFGSIVAYLKTIYSKDSCRIMHFGCKGSIVQAKLEKERAEELRKKVKMDLLQGTGVVKSGALTSYNPSEEMIMEEPNNGRDFENSKTTSATDNLQQGLQVTTENSSSEKAFVFKILIKDPPRPVWSCKTTNKPNEIGKILSPKPTGLPPPVKTSGILKKKNFTNFFIVLDGGIGDSPSISFSPSMFDCVFSTWEYPLPVKSNGGNKHYRKKLEIKDGYFGSKSETVRYIDSVASGEKKTAMPNKDPFELRTIDNVQLKTAMILSCFGKMNYGPEGAGLKGRSGLLAKYVSTCVAFMQEVAVLSKIKACYLTGNSLVHFSEIQVAKRAEDILTVDKVYESKVEELKLSYGYNMEKYFSTSFWSAYSEGGGGGGGERMEDKIIEEIFKHLYIGDVDKHIHEAVSDVKNQSPFLQTSGLGKHKLTTEEDDMAMEASKCVRSSGHSKICDNCLDCCDFSFGRKARKNTSNAEDLVNWYLCSFEKSKRVGTNHLNSGKPLDIRLPLLKRSGVIVLGNSVHDSKLTFTMQYRMPWYESVSKKARSSATVTAPFVPKPTSSVSGYLKEAMASVVDTAYSILEDDNEDGGGNSSNSSNLNQQRQQQQHYQPQDKGRSKREIRLAESGCYKKMSFLKGILFVIFFPSLQLVKSLPSYVKASTKRESNSSSSIDCFIAVP